MVKGSFWACVFAYVSTRVSHCTRLPFSLQCTMRIRDRIQDWTGTAEPSCAARTEDIPSPLPLRIQVLRENDLRAATNFGSSATSPAKVNKGGRGNVLVIGLPGEGRQRNPTSSSTRTSTRNSFKYVVCLFPLVIEQDTMSRRQCLENTVFENTRNDPGAIYIYMCVCIYIYIHIIPYLYLYVCVCVHLSACG